MAHYTKIIIECRCDECDKSITLGDNEGSLPSGWSMLSRKQSAGGNITTSKADYMLCDDCGPVNEIRCDCGEPMSQRCSGHCDNDD